MQNHFGTKGLCMKWGHPVWHDFFALVTYTDPENPNMMHTSVDAIRSGKCSDLG